MRYNHRSNQKSRVYGGGGLGRRFAMKFQEHNIKRLEDAKKEISEVLKLEWDYLNGMDTTDFGNILGAIDSILGRQK